MRVPARLGLLVLLAGPAGAEDLLPIYEEHKTVMRELAHALTAAAREREAYASAADPDAQLGKWAAQLENVSRLVDKQEALWLRHRNGVRRLQVDTVGGFINRIERKRDNQLYENQTRNELMRNLKDRHLAVFHAEIQYFRTVEMELLARRAAERRRKTMTRGFMAVGFGAILAALLWRWISRHRRVVILRPPPIPKLIAGNIAVKGLIGRGAMGEVYEALDRTIGRRVALKRLRPELLASPADLDGLLAEARVVASLKHDNLVAIYSVEREAGQVYLAFEFVDGQTLARAIAERGRLPWFEALRVFRGVCAALDYAHGRRVVHRDLKPANIMLDRSGTVKVMDFGIAFTAQKSISRLTRAAAWGTPPYMAPEQELGGVSAAVDLFAASICLYEMLTGRLPFKGPNFLAQKREGLFTPPRSIAPDLPKAVDGFFASALAPEPSKRYPTAAALAAAAEAAS